MSALTPGTRIGPYEIATPLGAGGMGEVYRARDTRLDRTVALKIVSGALANDPQNRERFEREARAISALNHPNICVLHDVGRETPVSPDAARTTNEAPVDFFVMEYLEGRTLAARLGESVASATDGVALPMPLDEALDIAIQMASALDRAHRQGIVHRDLKPGNVMLTRAARPGTASTSQVHVKLLDFGLARFTQAAAGAKSDSSVAGMVSIADLTMPTMASPLTMKGTIVGTLHYMAPEQLEGKDVDARADIFAFGVVLYEMLTGRRPFDGKSHASLIGAILDHEPPPIRSLQPSTPPLLDEIVSSCLAKSPDERWQSSRDLVRQLAWVAAHRTSPETATASLPAQPRTKGIVLRAIAGFAIAAGLGAGIVAWVMRPTPASPPLVARFALDLPEDQFFTRTGRRVVALSPDGKLLAYVANNQIYLRQLNQLTATPIAGTYLDPNEPVFSPDGQWIAFWANTQLQKIAVSGGTPIVLGAADNPLGLSWDGDRLLLGQTSPPGIIAIPAAGGSATRLVTLDEKSQELAQSPQLLAGGRAVLFTLKKPDRSWSEADIVVQNLTTGTRTVVVSGGTHGRVLPTGHLVYVNSSTLFAVPFDEATLTVSGDAVPVEQSVQLGTSGFSGTAQATWSNTGAFAFVSEDLLVDSALVWMDRQGKIQRTSAPERPYTFQRQMRMSPDGSRVAVPLGVESDQKSTRLQTGSYVGIWDIARATVTRLSAVDNAEAPVWTPDSRRVCYQNRPAVYCQAADGSGVAESIGSIKNLLYLGGISADGKQLLFQMRGSNGFGDLGVVAFGAPESARALLDASTDEGTLALSPDGKWLAYESNDGGSGGTEVFVRPFPNIAGGRWLVSVAGGIEPRWSRDGRELFYLSASGSRGVSPARAIMAVPIATGNSFEPGKPYEVVKLPAEGSRGYDVAPDGRFLLSVSKSFASGQRAERPRVVVVQNWLDDLKARVPTTRRD